MDGSLKSENLIKEIKNKMRDEGFDEDTIEHFINRLKSQLKRDGMASVLELLGEDRQDCDRLESLFGFSVKISRERVFEVRAEVDTQDENKYTYEYIYRFRFKIIDVNEDSLFEFIKGKLAEHINLIFSPQPNIRDLLKHYGFDNVPIGKKVFERKELSRESFCLYDGDDIELFDDSKLYNNISNIFKGLARETKFGKYRITINIYAILDGNKVCGEYNCDQYSNVNRVIIFSIDIDNHDRVERLKECNQIL